MPAYVFRYVTRYKKSDVYRDYQRIPGAKVAIMRTGRIFAALLSLAAFSVPLTAFAQETPAAAAPAPSYARHVAKGEESIRGRIDRFDGKYGLQVHDDRGFVDNVEMHQGTVINPTGLALQPGMSVTILGYNRGHAFAANEIDTPYVSYGFAPVVYPYSIGVGFGPVYFHHFR
jgi:hypothetical protein